MDENDLRIIKACMDAFDKDLIKRDQPPLGKLERVIIGGYIEWILENYPKIAKELTDEFTR